MHAVGAAQPLPESLLDLRLGLVGIPTPQVLQHEIVPLLEQFEGETKPAGSVRVHDGQATAAAWHAPERRINSRRRSCDTLTAMLRPALALSLVLACGGEPAKAPEKKPEPVKAEPAAKPEPAKVEPVKPPPDQKEACAQVLIVAWVGAEGGDASINRDEATARTRAEELRGKLLSGTAVATLAGESDEPKTKAKRGAMGTFERDKWPEKYAPLADPVFALQVGEVTEPVKLPFGWAVAQRCAIEKIHTAHILIRYKGAKNAEKNIKRDKAAAQKLAEKVLAEASKTGVDFAELAKKHSEDGSADKGGDLGSVGRGMFAPAYEDAAFALTKPGELTKVVETDFGFHIIQRVD
jgi:hypothetical protein